MRVAADQLAQLLKLGEKFREPAPEMDMSLRWEAGACVVEVSVRHGEVSVYFNSAHQVVDDIEAAASLLAQIFADDIVAVIGYANEEPVYFALAPRGAPSAGIGALDRSRSTLEVPHIDSFEELAWSDQR